VQHGPVVEVEVVRVQPVHDPHDPEFSFNVPTVSNLYHSTIFGSLYVHTDCPAGSAYLPNTQSVHTALPVVSLYFPIAHAEHDPPLGPVYPALQAQAVAAALAPGELELPGHARQVVETVAAGVAEYVPAPQLLQAALPLAIL
jgi:hypothetical protein